MLYYRILSIHEGKKRLLNSLNVKCVKKAYLDLLLALLVVLVLDLVVALPRTRPPFRSVSDNANAIATSRGGNTVSLPVVFRRRFRIGSSMLT